MSSDVNTGSRDLQKSDRLVINKYMPLAILYFFFNSFLLPHGLLYTTLLTPLFILWLIRYPIFNYTWYFFLVSIPFALIHFINGVNVADYLKSYILLFTAFIFCLVFYRFLRSCSSLEYIYRSILVINFFFVIIASIAYFIPVVRDVFWHGSIITTGVERVYRLKLLTYEASYYSLLLCPIAIYYYLRLLLFKVKDGFLILMLVTVPLILSLSFGVLLGIFLSIFLLYCSDIRLFSIHPKLLRYILYGLLIMLGVLFLALLFYPDNFIFVRIANLFKGKDTSFSGRTFDSIYLGWQVASQKSILFGAGPGQIEENGLLLFNDFYKHIFTADQVAIPNNIGDILAQYGLVGVLIKLGIEVYLFFRTKVFSNYYRIALFLFIFIYQFTGSFINNIAEYTIWILAFTPFLFPHFNKEHFFQNQGNNIKIPFQ